MNKTNLFACLVLGLALAGAACTNTSNPSSGSNGAAATGETSTAGVGGTTSVPAASANNPGGH